MGHRLDGHVHQLSVRAFVRRSRPGAKYRARAGSWDTAVTVTTSEDIGTLTAEIIFAEPPVINRVVYTAGDIGHRALGGHRGLCPKSEGTAGGMSVPR